MRVDDIVCTDVRTGAYVPDEHPVAAMTIALRRLTIGRDRSRVCAEAWATCLLAEAIHVVVTNSSMGDESVRRWIHLAADGVIDDLLAEAERKADRPSD